MPNSLSKAETSKCQKVIEKGKRGSWWQRRGTMQKGFSYVDATGKKLKNEQDIDRIRSLVIPPAWQFVRISPHSGGKLQAVGMDTTGRIQYLYHPDFTKKQQKKKFAKIERFGERLPALKEISNKHMSLKGLPRKKVLAVMMRLINSLYFRAGTDKSAKIYRTYGITTLRNNHLTIENNGRLRFEFIGKSHVKQRKILVDRSLSQIVRKLKKIGPKKRLFNYVDDEGKPRAIKPGDINDYIKKAVGDEFSSKDLRTWGASILCAKKLAEIGAGTDEKEVKKNIVDAVKYVAEELGNTPAVCRSSYIHPAIIEAYENGVTLKRYNQKKSKKIKRIERSHDPEEAALLKMLTKIAKPRSKK